MFIVTAQDCDSNNLLRRAEDVGYQVVLGSREELDAYLVNTKSGFGPAPEDGGPRPRNRVTKFLVAGPGMPAEVERGDAAHAAAVARYEHATAKPAKPAKPVEPEEVVELRKELGGLQARLARTKNEEKRATTSGLIAEVEQKLAALGAS